ncbi:MULTISPECIES: phosphonate ABC transporter ATP-binding protein [Prauserella salsuginis group]|uniref:Phosphonate ABC transporter ATP-binding protein n=1 Tax=Prauserella salsuginis TaxID=387889 RepID=A0ABW6G0D2_9PSEU|nr:MULTISPECIES: ATP-binding cassette domain-containing protein [Prauserella salsuginis group]MCR3721271.1 phosphonate transport system ATP-binding protein [Prauserella flava]MCR3734649.1 phosphonate transport system ATP-binding protein [Prauserella salsuginis]
MPDGSALRISNLRKSFGEHRVLDGIDVDVRAGEFVAVLGANGCGKSTALRCVVGLERPDAGEITVDGRPAMVFQRIHLVNRRSALDNVCAGALGRLPLRRSLSPRLFPRELREEAMWCLERVGLADHAGRRTGRLSGGQQQRVAIARALCQRTNVLLADEPVSALDPSAAVRISELLASLAAEGLAVVAVLHQPQLAVRCADRIVGLSGGQVTVDAPTGAVSSAELDALYVPGGVVV